MSRRDTVDELALETRCDYCDAGPGEWCRTRSGARATWLHHDRTRRLQSAYSAGFREGYGDARHDLAQTFQMRREGDQWTLRDKVPLVGADVIAYLRRRGWWTT